jgi:1-deoxy-D-xylulose-5-phosphate synthase
MAPKDENELQHMLRTAIEYPGPAAVRYPRGNGVGVPLDPEIKALPIGRAELLRDGSDVALVALGSMVHPAMEAADRLAGRGIRAAVLNARFAKPLDGEAIAGLARRCRALVSVEEHGGQGGFGGAVLEALAQAGLRLPVRCLGVPDRVVEHGDPAAQRAAFGLDPVGIERAAVALLEGLSA